MRKLEDIDRDLDEAGKAYFPEKWKYEALIAEREKYRRKISKTNTREWWLILRLRIIQRLLFELANGIWCNARYGEAREKIVESADQLGSAIRSIESEVKRRNENEIPYA